MKGIKVLVVDDEKLIRWSLGQLLAEQGWDVSEAESGEQALELLAGEEPDVVLLDFKLPGMNGLQVLEQIRQHWPRLEVVMMTAHGTLELAVKAMKLGAADYLRKPFDPEEVKLLVGRLADKMMLSGRLRRQLERRASLHGLDCLVGRSAPMRRLKEMLLQIDQQRPLNVLIEGESGTGKSLLARVLHHSGCRADQPFMEVSCTALSETLVESELFGHERGAFTDAKVRKRGIAELADGGTLFLDEVGDMPLSGQAKLLQMIEQRRFRRVGGVTDIEVDINVVAATNRQLGREVERGNFRKDLFFRLAALRIEIPPLRERREDLPDLCACFVSAFNREMNRRVTGVSSAALEMMMAYDWPGNVRELRNNIERAFVLGCRDEIGPQYLALGATAGQRPESSPASTPAVTTVGPAATLEQIEKQAIERALAASGGNQSAAARMLGVSRDTLRYRMQKHGLLVARHSKA